MKKKIIVVVVIAIGISLFLWRNARIDLPEIELVTELKLARTFVIDENRIIVDSAIIKNYSDIKAIMSLLSNAKRLIGTRIRAANEFPTGIGITPYLRINIYGDEHLMARIFLYTMENRGYIFVPYRAIYRIDSGIISEIYLMHLGMNCS